jgi:hypothetical protein
MLLILAAQLAAASVPPVASDQDRVTATEVFAYAQWRSCVLKVTHHKSRAIRDHVAVADAAISECGTREANYRSSLTSLAQLYQLKNPADFAQRNVNQARNKLHDLAINELK